MLYRLSVGDYWQGEGWVFTQDNGRMMNYSTPYKSLQDILTHYNADKAEADKLPMIPFHGLRHTTATLQIAAGTDVRTVSSTQSDGSMMSYSTPYATFQDAIDRYNADKEPADQLPHIPFHGLRHTSATLLIAAHQDVRTVSNRLGHAQASTTMNIYAHALKENDRTASNALENILCKTGA